MAAHLRDAVVDVIMVLTLVLAKQIAVPAVLDHDVDHFAVRNCCLLEVLAHVVVLRVAAMDVRQIGNDVLRGEQNILIATEQTQSLKFRFSGADDQNVTLTFVSTQFCESETA